MKMSRFNDTHVSPPADSGGRDVFDNTSQSRTRNQQSLSVRPGFDFKKPKIPLSVNRSKHSVPLCLLSQRGKCYYGENCRFSHSRSAVSGRNAGKECYYFSKGVDCPYGDKCQFLHEYDQNLGKYYDDKSILRKTKLCVKWERFGSCPYGERCVFAHGKAELKETYSLAEMEKFNTSSLKPNQIGTNTAKKLQLEGKSCFLKWNIKKISQIYGDWINDSHN